MAIRYPDQDTAVNGLREPFRARVRLLLERLERDGLPFIVFEARRTFTRQQSLYEKGRTLDNGVWRIRDRKQVVTNALPGEGPHNWGLAVDLVLDTESPWWGGARPTGPWDTGKDPAGRPLRPIVILAWEKYGRAVREAGLRWGGDWGWDLPHAEMLEWRSYRPADWRLVTRTELAASR